MPDQPSKNPKCKQRRPRSRCQSVFTMGRIILKRNPARSRSVCVNERCSEQRARYQRNNHELAQEINVLREHGDIIRSHEQILQKLTIKYAQAGAWIEAMRKHHEEIGRGLELIHTVANACSSIPAIKAHLLEEPTFITSTPNLNSESRLLPTELVIHKPHREHLRLDESLSTICEVPSENLSFRANSTQPADVTASREPQMESATSPPSSSSVPVLSRSNATAQETQPLDRQSGPKDSAHTPLMGIPDGADCKIDTRNRRKMRMMVREEVAEQPDRQINPRLDNKEDCISGNIDIIITRPSTILTFDSSQHVPVAGRSSTVDYLQAARVSRASVLSTSSNGRPQRRALVMEFTDDPSEAVNSKFTLSTDAGQTPEATERSETRSPMEKQSLMKADFDRPNLHVEKRQAKNNKRKWTRAFNSKISKSNNNNQPLKSLHDENENIETGRGRRSCDTTECPLTSNTVICAGEATMATRDSTPSEADQLQLSTLQSNMPIPEPAEGPAFNTRSRRRACNRENATRR